MYNNYNMYPCYYYGNTQDYASDMIYDTYNMYPCPYFAIYPSDFWRGYNEPYIPYDDQIEYDSRLDSSPPSKNEVSIELRDYGPQPFVVDINKVTRENNTFRTALWTGSHLQVTLMSINVGEDIGLEIHPDVDQFIRVEKGQGLVKMGKSKHNLDFQTKVYDDFAIMIPAGTWHNVVNTGNTPLKVYSIYAPPNHPRGTVHVTKEEAEAAEGDKISK
ncbi:cupin domain-containing protein [Clostridium kluyveri]|uniref:Cupin n=1 Tax=Clostridium kluyveri TaxID=1534 RepID=A0A1L5FB55_CLOKL|nr:cupin domain-containing protein [Clostridium kluyveri]APM40245.1 cupin [Clostridium kluyveri]